MDSVKTTTSVVEEKATVKTVVKTSKVDPCKKCSRTFDKKSGFCKSCLEYKGAIKWHEAK